jgi:hypothetical protein
MIGSGTPRMPGTIRGPYGSGCSETLSNSASTSSSAKSDQRRQAGRVAQIGLRNDTEAHLAERQRPDGAAGF